MNAADFDTEMEKLAYTFQKPINESWRNLVSEYYKLFKEVKIEDFKSAVRYIQSNCERFPYPAKVHESLRLTARIENQVIYADCNRCMGYGFINKDKEYGTFTRNGKELPLIANYTYRCTCEAGRAKNEELPIAN